MISRRSLFGLGLAALAAPAIVRASSIMAVRPTSPPEEACLWHFSHDPMLVSWSERHFDSPTLESIAKAHSMLTGAASDGLVICYLTEEQYRDLRSLASA